MVTAASARPIASISASRVRAPAFLSSPLTLAKACSMGLRSGECALGRPQGCPYPAYIKGRLEQR